MGHLLNVRATTRLPYRPSLTHAEFSCPRGPALIVFLKNHQRCSSSHFSLGEGSRYQFGWIFRKIPNGLRPPLIFGKLYCNFLWQIWLHICEEVWWPDSMKCRHMISILARLVFCTYHKIHKIDDNFLFFAIILQEIIAHFCFMFLHWDHNGDD